MKTDKARDIIIYYIYYGLRIDRTEIRSRRRSGGLLERLHPKER